VEKFTAMTPELHAYAVAHSAHQDDLLRRLEEETVEVAGGMAIMLTAPEQAALITLLVRALGARRALELGTFTGYGAISIARGQPPDGRLVTCDVSERWTAIARRYIDEAGLARRVEIRIGPALQTLHELPASEPFDFAFIDADKEAYPDYYEACLELLRPGGLIMLDNVFLGGDVVAERPPEERERQVAAITALNDRIAADERVERAMLGVSDGVTLVLKR
jgi:caffeoyl-CoA O-methyltransferase